MADERNGWLTPEQEEKLHKMLKLKGILGVIDLPILRLLDNLALQKVKGMLGENQEEILKVVYVIIDELFAALPDDISSLYQKPDVTITT